MRVHAGERQALGGPAEGKIMRLQAVLLVFIASALPATVSLADSAAPAPVPPPASIQVWGPQIERPKLLRKVIPEFASLPEARMSVTLALWIDEKGIVKRTDVLSGNPLLTTLAIDAALRWQFQPAKVAGVPVCSVETFTVPFKVVKK